MTATTYDGLLELTVAGTQWRRRQRPPLSLTVIDRPDRLLVIPTDQSGGQRGGDALAVTLSVDGPANVDWLPPSSTLFFPSRDRGGTCTVNNLLRVGSASRVCWWPPVAIPCAGAHVRQHTSIELERGAEFLFCDGWTDGRTSSGERGRFSSLANELRLTVEGSLVFQERWTLEGGSSPPGPDPAGFQGACQWLLCLAAGETARNALETRVAAWKHRGAAAELGELDDGLWLARVLSTAPWGNQPFRF